MAMNKENKKMIMINIARESFISLPREFATTGLIPTKHGRFGETRDVIIITHAKLEIKRFIIVTMIRGISLSFQHYA